MPKDRMERELKKHLIALIKGDPEECRNAKKEIDKLWHKDHEAFKNSAPVALKYLSMFDSIKNARNQAAFASGLSLFYLVLGDDYFDILKDFTLKALQHSNGTIRQAILNTADWLYISLTARINPYVYPKGKKLTEKQKNMEKEVKIQYINLVREIELLIDRYYEENEGVEYVQDMKPSVNKSLQFFWSRLTESRVYQRIVVQVRSVPLEVAKKRKEVEKKLQELLKTTRSSFNLEDIKDIIYNENGHESLKDIIAIFDTGQNMLKIEDILQTVNDAWNYFPHKTLEGLSPTEKFMEYQKIPTKSTPVVM